MSDSVQSGSDRCRCLRQVLLDLLMSHNALPWPGADGVTVEEVLAAYVPTSERGRVPDEDELIRRHPELTSEIVLFFTPAGPRADCLGRQGPVGRAGSEGETPAPPEARPLRGDSIPLPRPSTT